MKKTIILAVLSVMTFAAQAKDCDEGTMNAVEFRACIEGQAEQSVRNAFNNLIKALEPNQTAIDAIRQAQAHWVQFRDATCYYVSETATREDGAYCVDEFNQARVKTLNRYAKEAIDE